MESAGARLKKIRLEKGFSLEEVQKKTKIHLNIIKAIEEDSPVNLSPVYIKGFLKIYCKFLGVEHADYVPGHKESQARMEAQGLKQEPAAKDNPIPSFFQTASIKLGTFSRSKKIRQILKVCLIAAVSAIVLFNLGKFVSSRKRSSKQARPAAFVREPEKKRVAAVQQQKSQVSSSNQKAKSRETLPAKSVSSGIRLGILAREDCWVTLKADGRIVFHSTLKKGKSESWQAKDKMELSLGNAGAVELIVNGERISSLGKKGQSLKNILITKEGLSVQ